MKGSEFNTIPRMKEGCPNGKVFPFGNELRYQIDAATDCAVAINLLREFCAREEIRLVEDSVSPQLVFAKEIGAAFKTEACTLNVSEQKAVIGYVDPAAARNAVANFAALVTRNAVNGDETFARKQAHFSIPCGDYADAPDSRYRGIMIDVARQYIPLEELRLRIRQLAYAKYNVLHLHLMDTERYALRSDALRILNDRAVFRQYSPCELRALDDYARSLGVTMIPEIDLPGHGVFLLDAMPQLRCVKDGNPIGIWDLCVANDACYELIDKLFDELSTVFSSEYLHIGGDELCFYDLEWLGYWPHWGDCDRCRALKAEHGYLDDSDMFCHFVRRVHAIAARKGKKLMIWSDAVDVSRAVDLPRDILIQFWRVAHPKRGPHEGCSMQRWLEEGFSVVNSFYEEVYIDDYVTLPRLSQWNPRTSPGNDRRHDAQIVGGEMCAWGTRDHFTYTLPAAIVLFGDRLWHDAPLVIDDALTQALTHAVISCEETYPDVFRCLGGALPPLYGRDKFVPSDGVTAEQVEACIARIRRTIAAGRCEKSVLIEYVRCLEDARKYYTAGTEEPEHHGDA